MEGRRAVCLEACGFGKQVNLGRNHPNRDPFVLPNAVGGMGTRGEAAVVVQPLSPQWAPG